MQGWITILKFICLGAFALSGLSIGWRNSANLADRTPLDGKLAVTLMSSMVYIYYAYTGWNSASYLAGEVKDSQRKLPQAILLGTAVVTVLVPRPQCRLRAGAIGCGYSRKLSTIPQITRDLKQLPPIAQLAATRLFGASWSMAAQHRLRLDAPFHVERLCLDRATRRVCDGPRRASSRPLPLGLPGEQARH